MYYENMTKEKKMFWMLSPLIVVTILIVLSCENEDVYELGSEWAVSDLNIYRIDTLTVNTYTIQLDSTITSGQSSILVGKNSDPIFGKINANSFFQVDPQALSIDKEAIFDSAAILLRYDNYSFGDTLTPFQIKLHRLTDRIRMNSETGYLYNTSQINYEESTIGETTFTPRPNELDAYVRIHVDNDLSNDLFSFLQNEDIEENEKFIIHFKGFALTASESTNSILRFSTSKSDSLVTHTGELITTPVFRMYYHYQPEDGNIAEVKHFNLSINSSAQFNQISSDFTGSELEGLSPDNPIPSESTGNKTFIQSGLGIFTRIEIPYLKSLYGIDGHLKLMSGQLNLRPVNNTYSYPYLLPSTLNYFQGNKTDDIIGSFVNGSDEEIAIQSYINSQFQEDNYFQASVTTFIQSVFDSETDNDYTLLIYSTTYPAQSLDRVVIGSPDFVVNPMELFVNILTY